MQLRVARVEHGAAQRLVVKEEASAEVIDSLLRLRQELVGYESDMIAGAAEQFGEQRIVAPVAGIANGIHGEEVLEDVAREIPWRHGILHLYQLAAPLALHLPWCGLLAVAIQLRVVAVVTLAYDKHDVRRGETATVNARLVDAADEPRNLLRRYAVGMDAEHKGQS